MNSTSSPKRWLIVAAFACVYLIWGSSYIGIRFAIETIPPFLMTTVRFLIAGGLLIGWALARGAALPKRIHWRSASIAAAFMFLMNNTMLVWSQANGLPSGVAAVLIATLPMWIVILQWIRGTRPTLITGIGLTAGFIGVTLLIAPGSIAVSAMHPLAPFVIVLAAGCWAVGGLFARTAPLPDNTTLSTGMQLLMGGLMIGVFSVVTGDAATLDLSAITPTSLVAMAHLTIMSSVVAFSAYTWLMKVVSPSQVATYAYVNPVIAMFLGWLLANEPITTPKVVAAFIILAGVVLITMYGSRRLSFRREERTPAAESV